MGLFNFGRKQESELSDRERYGLAWLKIVGKGRAKGLRIMRELSEEGFVEATVALAMFAGSASERKALYESVLDSNHCEALWGYTAFLPHAFCPNPNNGNDERWVNMVLKAAEHGCVDAMNEMGNICNRNNKYAESMYWYVMANAHDFPDGSISLAGIAKKWAAAGKPYAFDARTSSFTEARFKCAITYLEMHSNTKRTIPLDDIIRLTLAGEPIAAYLAGDIFEADEQHEMAYRMYNAISFENDPHGLRCYADMLYTGRGVDMDRKNALRMYETAAELGERAAMFVTGHFWESTNKNMAAYWLGMSHVRGFAPALQKLIQLS